MKRIIRTELRFTDVQHVDLTGEILSVAMSRTEPNQRFDMWSIDQEYEQPHKVEITVYGTGNAIRSFSDFVGTVVTPCGLVWHVFSDSNER